MAEQLEEAGRDAAHRGALEAATELFESACRLTPARQPLKLARRMLEQGSASLVTGNFAGARKMAARVIETAPAIRGEALELLSDAAWVEGLARWPGSTWKRLTRWLAMIETLRRGSSPS